MIARLQRMNEECLWPFSYVQEKGHFLNIWMFIKGDDFMIKAGIKQKAISIGMIFFVIFQIMLSPLAVNAATPTNVPISEASNMVKRLSGIDRYETAAKIAQEGWKTTSEYAVLAAGSDNNLVDALAAVPLAKLKNAPLLLTQSDSLNTYTEAELKRLEVKNVYVVTGNGVMDQNIFEKLVKMDIKVISLGGKDRFETSVNIAQELGTPMKIILTTASSNADALSIAPIAAAQGIPILLSDKDKLSDSVALFLKNNEGNVKKSYVIGGQGVIGDSVKNGLSNPIRVGGADRYETNVEILKTFADSVSYRNTFVANGEDEHLVDALAGAPLAATNASPLLLTSQQITDSTREFAKLNLSSNMIALGGQNAISDTIIDQLTSADIISKESYVEWSKDVNNPKGLKDSLKITADNVVVENLTTPYSILIQGDNTKLKNVKVGGTVFIDPGENGTASLDNVTAGKIVVLSGATQSIHLLDVIAEMLRIASSTQVRVVTSGVTNISNTVVSSDAILDVAEGSVGTVEIYDVINSQSLTIELRGTYAEPVLVSSGATVIAGASSDISSLEIAPEDRNQTITLEGTFYKVELNSIANINLSSNALINSLITNARAYIDVLTGARVVNYDDKGNKGIITGTGADDVFSSAHASSSSSGGGTFVNTTTSIPLGFTPTDQLMDPTQPVIYMTDKTNKKVYSVNYETKQISSIDFDLPPERLAYENNELFVTLLKGNHEYWTTNPLAGAIAIINTGTFTLSDRFDIDTDPFDLVVRNGYIYVIPGSNQWVPISSYSRLTKLKVANSSSNIRFQSFTELNPVSDTIVTVDTDVSPRDMSLVNISNGNVVGSIVDSPYHGNYPMTTNFGVSLDGKYVFNGSGEVFDANLNHVKTLNNAFYDIAFNPINNNFYTADKLNNTITAYAYDPSNVFQPIATYHTNSAVSRLFFQNDRLIAVSGNTVDVIQLPLTGTPLNPKVTINGPSWATVPAGAHPTSSDYTAMVRDESGNIYSNYAVNWSLQSPVTGVSLSTTNGSRTLLNIDSTTTASAITLCASVGDVTTTQAIKLAPLSPQVTINGPSQLTVPEGSNTTTSNFSAAVKDQFGTTINAYPVDWSLQSPVTGVSLSTVNGSSTALNVAGTTTASAITLVASVGGVTTSQAIQLTQIISLGFTPTDQLMDPVKPVVYFTDKPNNKVYAVNYETKQISSLTFDLPPERLAYENNELYVTLLKGDHQYLTTTPLAGAIAIINTDSLLEVDRLNIDTDPYDLVVRNGYIYVIPGSNQWVPISSYSRSSKLKVADSSSTIRFQSFAELNPLSDTIVTVDTDVSPRNLSLVNINSSNGTVVSIVGSPYNGAYPMTTNFRISADGKYVFNGSGEVFDANNLTHVKTLNDAFYDIAFNPANNNFYTADKLNNTITEYAYDTTNTFVPIATYHTDGPVSHLFLQNGRLITVQGNRIIQIPVSL